MRLGSRKVIKRMGEFKQEGSLVSVKLYNHATYMTLFDNKLLNGSEEAKRSDINHWNSQVIDDQDTRKVLVFSEQFVE